MLAATARLPLELMQGLTQLEQLDLANSKWTIDQAGKQRQQRQQRQQRKQRKHLHSQFYIAMLKLRDFR